MRNSMTTTEEGLGKEEIFKTISVLRYSIIYNKIYVKNFYTDVFCYLGNIVSEIVRAR